MSNVIQFTPLYGASDTDPLCYLLEIDDCRILLDIGWDEHFRERDIEALGRVVSDVDAVLSKVGDNNLHLVNTGIVSHPDIAHIGALSYAVGQLGLDCPIFSTQPVWRMGWMFM
jgi:cleavage and polyadenylation specificity factor subunit 2